MRNEDRFDVYPLEGEAGICKTCGNNLEYREATRHDMIYQDVYRISMGAKTKYYKTICPSCKNDFDKMVKSVGNVYECEKYDGLSDY